MSNKTHFTWSIEGLDETCPDCGERTVLVIADPDWREDCGEDDETHTIEEEITGHYCPDCRKLVSLSFNS